MGDIPETSEYSNFKALEFISFWNREFWLLDTMLVFGESMESEISDKRHVKFSYKGFCDGIEKHSSDLINSTQLA